LLGQLVVFVVLGIAVGWIGRFVVVGRPCSSAASWIASGVAGALLGGAIGGIAGARAPDLATGACLASYVGAIAAAALHHAREGARHDPFRATLTGRPSGGIER
jgi:uncharacterized membrane protein YeaQ/YmgE (transglycosylase-associated protein family)